MNTYEKIEEAEDEEEYLFFPLQESDMGGEDPIDLFTMLISQIEGEIL